jgi:hypothetical protein
MKLREKTLQNIERENSPKSHKFLKTPLISPQGKDEITRNWLRKLTVFSESVIALGAA